MTSQRVGIVIPVYKGSDLLPEAIESLKSVRFEGFRVVIVDDGSKDGTFEVAMRLAGELPNALAVSKPNGGLSSARNRGLDELGDIEFLQFLDHDDLIFDDKLDWQVTYLDEHPEAVAVFGQAEYFSQGASVVEVGTRPTQAEWRASLNNRDHNVIPVNSVLLRNRGLRFDERLKTHEDWDYWFRLSKYGEIHFVERQCCGVRVHPTSMSNNTGRMDIGRALVFARHARGLVSILKAVNRVRIALERGSYNDEQLPFLRPSWRVPISMYCSLMRRLTTAAATLKRHFLDGRRLQ